MRQLRVIGRLIVSVAICSSGAAAEETFQKLTGRTNSRKNCWHGSVRRSALARLLRPDRKGDKLLRETCRVREDRGHHQKVRNLIAPH